MAITSNSTDSEIENEIISVNKKIEDWAKSKDLWYDSGFHSVDEYYDCQPFSHPPISVLWSEGGGLSNVIFGEDSCGYQSELLDLLEEAGYFYECINYTEAAIFPINDDVANKFYEYFHWKWVCSLIKEDTSDIYEELYSHFERKPQDLHRIGWRNFEILLFRIFQNQGFKAILGPGRNDGGIDLKLIHENPLGDVLTIVQAKNYSENYKIGLTDVAALYGISLDAKGDKCLFVTSSSYLPVAKKFASRQNGYIQLSEKNELIEWCRNSKNGILEDKSRLISKANVSSLILDLIENKKNLIVTATWGQNMTINKFAIIVKESKYAALLMGVENRIITNDGYNQVGAEVPLLDIKNIDNLLVKDNVWRAKKNIEGNKLSYWDGRHSYFIWNGNPKYFNHMD